MALMIPSFTTEYGDERNDIYCCITVCNYNAITKELLFSIRPFTSKTAKDNGYTALPIGALDLGGTIQNVEHGEDMLSVAYNWIKMQTQLAVAENAEELSLDYDHPEYTTAIKWKAYEHAIDC